MVGMRQVCQQWGITFMALVCVAMEFLSQSGTWEDEAGSPPYHYPGVTKDRVAGFYIGVPKLQLMGTPCCKYSVGTHTQTCLIHVWIQILHCYWKGQDQPKFHQDWFLVT